MLTLKTLLLWLICAGELQCAMVNRIVGYVGPACVVVDELLYLHGHYVRRLEPTEVFAFKKYQNTLSLLRQLKDAVSKGATLLNNGSISLPSPVIPAFCEGYDDNTEVVLNGCTVKGGHVYIDDKVVRPLNILERQKILLVTESFRFPHVRVRRNTSEAAVNVATTTTSPPITIVTVQSTTTPTLNATPKLSNELKELINKALNINGNITDRFLPVANASPLLNHFLEDQKGTQPLSDDVDQQLDPKQKEKIQDFIQDHIMRYQARKAETTPKTTTEIPHITLENDYGGAIANKSANYALILQLLKAYAASKAQQDIMRQQLAGYNRQPWPIPPAPRSYPGSSPMTPGDTMEIGGQTYVAVPLHSQNGAIGLVPAHTATNTHTVTAMPPFSPVNTLNGQPWNVPDFTHTDEVRFHPGKRRLPPPPLVPSHVNGVQLPHDICVLTRQMWAPA